jgi:hypothetical protein
MEQEQSGEQGIQRFGAKYDRNTSTQYFLFKITTIISDHDLPRHPDPAPLDVDFVLGQDGPHHHKDGVQVGPVLVWSLARPYPNFAPKDRVEVIVVRALRDPEGQKLAPLVPLAHGQIFNHFGKNLSPSIRLALVTPKCYWRDVQTLGLMSTSLKMANRDSLATFLAPARLVMDVFWGGSDISANFSFKIVMTHGVLFFIALGTGGRPCGGVGHIVPGHVVLHGLDLREVRALVLRGRRFFNLYLCCFLS